MAFGTLYTFPGDHPRSIGIKAAAKANNLELRVVEEPKIPEHLAVSKLGKVPAFHGEDGLKLFECIAIAIYITSHNEQTTLLGGTRQEYAHILKWMSFFNTEILIPLVEMYLPLIGIRPYDHSTVTAHETAAQAAVDVVEEHLLTQHNNNHNNDNNNHTLFLVGDQLTLADLFCAGIIAFGFQFFYGKKWRAANPHVARWYEGVVGMPVYQAGLTEQVTFLEEPRLRNVQPDGVEIRGVGSEDG
ncbi:elongation factor EF-1 gamma subunit [Xanthoria calcicola]